MNILKKLALSLSVVALASALTLTASAQTANTALRFKGLSTTTRATMRAEASSTRAENMATREAAMIQKGIADADKAISMRITSLNNLLSRIESIKNVSAADKATIASTTQSEIDAMTALKTKIDADAATTTLRDDLKSITANYRVYALVEPQIQILAAADKINQIISLMNTVESKLQARITALPAGANIASLSSAMSDIIAKIADAQTQAAAAVSKTATLVPDQGNAATASANTTALKGARADIRVGNSDLKTVRKDMNDVVSGIRKLVPKIKELKTINGTTTPSTASGTPITQ